MNGVDEKGRVEAKLEDFLHEAEVEELDLQVRITASGANSPFSGARDEFHLATYPPQNMK